MPIEHTILILTFSVIGIIAALGSGFDAFGCAGNNEPSQALRRLLSALGWALFTGIWLGQWLLRV